MGGRPAAESLPQRTPGLGSEGAESGGKLSRTALCGPPKGMGHQVKTPAPVPPSRQDGGSPPGRRLPVHGQPGRGGLPAEPGSAEADLPVGPPFLEETVHPAQGELGGRTGGAPTSLHPTGHTFLWLEGEQVAGHWPGCLPGSPLPSPGRLSMGGPQPIPIAGSTPTSARDPSCVVAWPAFARQRRGR